MILKQNLDVLVSKYIGMQCSKLKKNPGCPYFKSLATKAVNLVAR